MSNPHRRLVVAAVFLVLTSSMTLLANIPAAQADIIWRYYGSGYQTGQNVVWYMGDGAAIKSQEFLTPVADTYWRIVNR